MKMKIPSELRPLRDKFAQGGYKLYAVGGMARNALLNLPASDYDLTGAATPQQVVGLFWDDPDFQVIPKAPDFGTVEIHYDFGRERVQIEYTTFRSDTYGAQGNHRPKGVIFTDDLEQDAFRRDFTVNALYADLTDGFVIDPTGGVKDLERRILRVTSHNPAVILKYDGLRLLRLVRLASELGFDLDPETARVASLYSGLLEDIPQERIANELKKILMSDVRYEIEQPAGGNSVFWGLTNLYILGFLPYIIPELLEGESLVQDRRCHAYTVMWHGFRTAAASQANPTLRLAALLHDVGKPRVWRDTGRMIGHDEVGAQLAKEILTRLRFSKKEIREVETLVKIHMFDIEGLARENRIRKRFARLGWETSKNFVALRKADSLGSGVQHPPMASWRRFYRVLGDMEGKGTPFSMKDLKISGQQIMEATGLPPSTEIQAIKEKLFDHVVLRPMDNHLERLKVLSAQTLKQIKNERKNLDL